MICSNCISESFLRSRMADTGSLGICCYCGNDGTVVSISEVSRDMAKALQSHYRRTPPEPSSFELALQKEGIQDYERDGESILDVIQSVAGVSEQPAEDIRLVLADKYDESSVGKFDGEHPFGSSALYIEDDVDDSKYRQRWTDFENRIKTETRFFSEQGTRTLDSVFGVLRDPKYNSDKLTLEFDTDEENSSLYRARVFESQKDLLSALKRPDLHLGPPPSAKARAGRMNASGISVFYGATTEMGAVTEVRPPVGSLVLVGKFRSIHKLRLLDVRKMDSVVARGSPFDPDTAHRRSKAKFLETLKQRITMPITPGDESSEYLATQFIAEYLAYRHKALDGIMYPSAQDKSGANVMLFHRSSRIELLASSTSYEMNVHYHPDLGYYVSEPKVDRRRRSIDEGQTDHDHAFDQRHTVLEIDSGSLKVRTIAAVNYSTTVLNVDRVKE